MPKGSKTCPNPKCNNLCGPRSFECNSCGHIFIFKSKVATQAAKTKVTRERRYRTVPIEDLVKGDTIKVKPGSYYVTNDGKKMPMGEKGMFTFVKHAPNGILASSRKLGYIFLYTGPDEDSSITGTHLRSHRIKKLIKK